GRAGPQQEVLAPEGALDLGGDVEDDHEVLPDELGGGGVRRDSRAAEDAPRAHDAPDAVDERIAHLLRRPQHGQQAEVAVVQGLEGPAVAAPLNREREGSTARGSRGRPPPPGSEGAGPSDAEVERAERAGAGGSIRN